MALQNFSLKPIKEYFTSQFHIPNYQREYSWEKDNLEDFWADLENLIDNNKKSQNDTHFFGQILIHKDAADNKKYIIDGQQRTTTAIIFLRAVQSICESIVKSENSPEISRDAQDIINEISGSFIGSQRRGTEQLKLTLGEKDKEYFKKYIQKGYPIAKREKIKSHERIRFAYWFFKESLESKINNIQNNEKRFDYLNNIYETFINFFTVMYIEATDLGEAFIIFETLNARGRELETSDLLKNYIFSKSAGNIETSEKNWNIMLNNLGYSDTTKFIRHFWNSSNDFTREKFLYKKITDTIDTPRRSELFLKSLKDYSAYYNSLNYPLESNFLKNVQLKTSIANLKLLKASSYYPVILSLVQRDEFNESDLFEIVSKIESLVFRNFTISGNNPNGAEIFFSDLAKKIYEKTLGNKIEIIKAISKKICEDSSFIEEFKTWEGSTNQKETIRYIFRKIHSYLYKNHEININNNEVHIEHIMPENSQKWTIDDEIHDNYLWRLGNLILLSGPINIEISNKPFLDKKKRYLDSDIKPNNELAFFETWTEKEINKRQADLANYAIKIWTK